MDETQYMVDNILSYLMDTFQEHSNLNFQESNIDEYSPFSDMEIDSIDLIKIILKIEEKFGFEFTNEELTLNDVNCIREMASFVMSHK